MTSVGDIRGDVNETAGVLSSSMSGKLTDSGIVQIPADLRALTKLEHVSLSDMYCHFMLAADISGLANLPTSIRSVDLSHLGHVVMSRSIASLALQPNLGRVKFRHCQPLVENMGDDIYSYAALCFVGLFGPPPPPPKGHMHYPQGCSSGQQSAVTCLVHQCWPLSLHHVQAKG